MTVDIGDTVEVDTAARNAGHTLINSKNAEEFVIATPA